MGSSRRDPYGTTSANVTLSTLNLHTGRLGFPKTVKHPQASLATPLRGGFQNIQCFHLHHGVHSSGGPNPPRVVQNGPSPGTRQPRQMPPPEPYSVGKSTSLVLRCSTCRGLPPKVRRSCSICRPASMLASRPCSRRRWRSVCSLTDSRAVPATVRATS